MSVAALTRHAIVAVMTVSTYVSEAVEQLKLQQQQHLPCRRLRPQGCHLCSRWPVLVLRGIQVVLLPLWAGGKLLELVLAHCWPACHDPRKNTALLLVR